MRGRYFRILLVFVVLMSSALGQSEKPGDPGPQEEEVENTIPASNPFPVPVRSSLVVAGRVVFADGVAVPEIPVTITCTGGRFSETAFSDAAGEFSFVLMTSQARPNRGQAGSAEKRTLRERFGTCAVIARLEGFVSDRISVSPMGSQRDIGTIVLHRRNHTSGSTVSLTTLGASEEAFKAYEKGKGLLEREKPDYSGAAEEFQKAVEEYPDFAAAWYYLGNCQVARNSLPEALRVYHKAVELDSDYLLPYVKISEVLLQQGEMKQSAEWASRALEKNPSFTAAQYVHAFANYYLGNVDLARESVMSVRASSTISNYPGAHFLLGAIHATNGELESAASEFRRFLELEPESAYSKDVERQLKEWEEGGLVAKSIP